MCTESLAGLLDYHIHPRYLTSRLAGTAERGPKYSGTHRDHLGRPSYPSPPMSNPPSPSGSPHERRVVSPAKTSPPASSSIASLSTTAPMPAVAALLPPAYPSLGSPFREPIAGTSSYSRINAPAFGTIRTPATPSSSAALFATPPTPTPLAPSQFSTGRLATVASRQDESSGVFAPVGFGGTPEDEPTSSRGSRKFKAHVASACVNCKRAHLSCDINRPCTRCVTSGKQDTCFDVQHKKRGRPRLRESGFREGNSPLDVTPLSTISLASGEQTARIIAPTRSRRGASFRSHQSQNSDASTSSMMSPLYSAHSTGSSGSMPISYANPVPRSIEYPSNNETIPTAFLDLDLVILRANLSFRQIMTSGQDVVGIALDDIAAPAAETELFRDLRTRLRTEREERDPAFLPPIMQPGQDPLQPLVEADADRYTQGFDDHTYTLMSRPVGGAPSSSFHARVRLARAGVYFVVVTLPSFRFPDPEPLQMYTRSGPVPPSSHPAPALAPDPFNAPRAPRQNPPLAPPVAPHQRPLAPTSYSPAYPAPSTPPRQPNSSFLPVQSSPLYAYSTPTPHQQQQQQQQPPPLPLQAPPLQQPHLPPPASSHATDISPFPPASRLAPVPFSASQLSQPVPVPPSLPPFASAGVLRRVLPPPPHPPPSSPPPPPQASTEDDDEDDLDGTQARKRRRFEMGIDRVLRKDDEE